MRRKRRTKYTWLPAYGTGIPIQGIGNFETHLRFGTLNVLASGVPAVGIIGVLPDKAPENFDGSTTPLANAITSEYILRRIVGKLHLTYTQDPRAYDTGHPIIPEGVIVTAGFFVARENDVSQLDAEGAPIGFVDGVSIPDFNNYSPQARDTQREPWIWKRTWILGNNKDARKLLTSGSNFEQGWAWFPPNNALCGSVLDGPHFDAKTVRRVGQDERLWFALATQEIVSDEGAINDGVLNYVLDARYLGALRKPRQRGAF